MKEIVLVAPFKDLYEMSEKIIKEKGYTNIEVVLGNLNEGVKKAKKAVENGANIIISRGGTYININKAVSVPTIEIKVTSFDILRQFKDIIKYKDEIVVTGYENIIDGVGVVKDVLGLNITKVIINSEEEVEEKIKYYVDKGVKVFVSDAITHKYITKFNCNSYIVKSGRESLINAIEEANRVLKGSRREKQKSQIFKTVIDVVDNGIVAIDSEKKISVFNSVAKKIFKTKPEYAIGKDVSEIIKNTKLNKTAKTGKIELGEIQQVGKYQIATNRIPIVVDNKITGAVATFKDITEIQELEKKVRIKLSKKGFLAKYKFEDIVYKSDSMKQCIKKAKKYSKYDSPILITGPSGVGKELFSQSIHNYSRRKNGPFVAINCAALPPNLIESELFGYVEGAFTGASKGGKAGLFELAHKGTIFLDEIGELPLSIQGRLLRVLQEKEVMRIGDDKVIPIDVRVISATNKNLIEMVEKNLFREDLYFRINILFLNVLSLNERKEDIISLSNFFIRKYSKKYSKNIVDISSEAKEKLLKYRYKGNARELQGILERGVILCENFKLECEDLLIDNNNSFNENNLKTKENTLEKKDSSSCYIVKENMSLENIKKGYIEFILNKCNGSVNEASKILKIDRSTIWRKVNHNKKMM